MNIESTLRERIAKLEEELAEAQETIRFLEAPSTENFDPWFLLGKYFRLTPRERKVLHKLYRSRMPVSCSDMEEDIWVPGSSPSTFGVWVFNLRQKLGKNVIQSFYGSGYRLSDSGRSLIRHHLELIARDAA